MTVIDTPEGIAFVQLCARRGALQLELVGLKRRGRTAYSICKEVYGLKGSRVNVLLQMTALIDKAQGERYARRLCACCQVPEHDICDPLDPSCSCCRDTMRDD